MNLLVTGAWNDASIYISKLESLGHNIFFLQLEKDKIPCSYDEIEAIICNGLFLYHHIEKFTNLKYVQITSAGYDRVPMEYIQNHNILIFNARGVYSIPMAEFALCGVLQIYKKSMFFLQNQLQSKWEKNRHIFELYGKTVCIVGCGSIGDECAKRFLAMGCKIIGVDLNLSKNIIYHSKLNIKELNKAVKISDIVIFTLPLTKSTYHIINDNLLNKMKKNSILVNIARGGLLETNSLIKHLDSNLLGAVLDVFEEEPLKSDDKLWEVENLIITPHNSFVSENNNKRLNTLIVDNVIKYL